MRALIIGDVVGEVGLRALIEHLPALREEHSPDVVIVNAENSAAGTGTTERQARRLLEAGVDVLTGGNHTLHERSLFPVLEREDRVLRPANFPKRSPGKGVAVVDAGGYRVGVVNLLGTIFVQGATSPFEIAEDLVMRLRKEAQFVFVDIHAEATSEKMALAWHLDGKATAVVGTHTHVQTADARILPGGTAYLTDLGMTGPHDSVIGVKADIIVRRFLTGASERFATATEGVRIQGALIEAGPDGRATAIRTIDIPVAAEA